MAKQSKSRFDEIAMLELRGLIAGYDYGSLTQTSTVDTFTYKQGGASGTTLAILAITYTDSTKATIDHWTIT